MGKRRVEILSSSCDRRGRRAVNTASGRGGAAVSNQRGELVSPGGLPDYIDNLGGHHTLGKGKGKVEAAYSPALRCSHGPCVGAPAAARPTGCSPRVCSTSRRRRTEAHCLKAGGPYAAQEREGEVLIAPAPCWLTPRGGHEATRRGAATSLVVPPRLQQDGLVPAALAAHRAESTTEGWRWHPVISARPRHRRPCEQVGRVSGARKCFTAGARGRAGLKLCVHALPLFRDDGCGAVGHPTVPHPRGV
jgi:hypothetical protein